MKGIEAAPALSAHPDAGNVQLAVGLVGKGQLAVAENQKPGSGLRRLGQETAAVKSAFDGREWNRGLGSGHAVTVSRRA